ncbi:unnamed protein product [Brassica oleracea]|uniref:Uncharacterized protein n=1 Tax=Brassica oleracea TaxID=3712 RepID=A0A3P6B258_BRAOL|nr:unnamed protein product [Brassica oleracea]
MVNMSLDPGLCFHGFVQGPALIATLWYREASNFVVIAKLTSKSQLRRVLECLKSRNNVAAFVELPDNTALSCIDSLVNSTQVVGGMERPSCHVHGGLVGADVFGWTIAYKPFTDDKEEDACSCYWSFH